MFAYQDVGRKEEEKLFKGNIFYYYYVQTAPEVALRFEFPSSRNVKEFLESMGEGQESSALQFIGLYTSKSLKLLTSMCLTPPRNPCMCRSSTNLLAERDNCPFHTHQ